MTPRARKITGDSFTPHPERDRARRYKHRGITAWILQWVEPEIADAPLALALPTSRASVVSILSPRFSDGEVLKAARAIYIAHRATPAGILAIFHLEQELRRTPERWPLAPKYARISRQFGDESITAESRGRFRIGRDPCLYARKVTRLRERPGGVLAWDEIPLSPDVRPA